MGEIRFLAEVSRRSTQKPSYATPEAAYGSNKYLTIYKIYIGKHPKDTYWTEWGGWYDHEESEKIELFFEKWLYPVNSMDDLIDISESFFVDKDYVYINLYKHPWLYSEYENIMAVRQMFLSAPKDSRNPSDIFMKDAKGSDTGSNAPALLATPSIAVKLSDSVSGLTKYSSFNFSLVNNNGFFDGIDTMGYFNSPAYIRKTTTDKPEYIDFIPIRAGFVENVKINDKSADITCADKYRALDEPVCKLITKEEYPVDLENNGSGAEGKFLPVAYGSVTLPLIILKYQEIEYKVPEKNKDGKDVEVSYVDISAIYMAAEYISDANNIYDDNGDSVSYSMELKGNLIYMNVNKVLKSDVQKPKYIITNGYNERRTGAILIDLMKRTDTQKYIDTNWDIAETNEYMQNSPYINIAITGGTVKSAIEQVLKNDMAFLIQKNDGRFSLRTYGKTYTVHDINDWRITQNPQIDFSEAQQRYFSDCIIKYNYNEYTQKHEEQYVFNENHASSVGAYTKTIEKAFETRLIDASSAEALARKLGDRFSKLRYTITLGVGVDTSRINLLDIVKMKISANKRTYSEHEYWMVREYDPAQDRLVLEEYDYKE